MTRKGSLAKAADAVSDNSIPTSSQSVNKQYSVSERTPEQKKEILAQARRYASGEISEEEYSDLFDEYYNGGTERQYSFAGQKASTANLEHLKNAQEMETLGADMESIRKATGWFKGRDGKWRFEIDDSKAEFRRDGDARLMQEKGYQRMLELTDKWIASINVKSL